MKSLSDILSFSFFLMVFIIPVLLLTVGVISYDDRYFVLLGIALIMGVYANMRGMSLAELGVSMFYFKESLLWNLITTLFLCLILGVLYLTGSIRTPTIPDWNLFFLFYIFISCPLQEFLYRSLFFAELKRRHINKALPLIVFSSLNFCFLHTFYMDWITSLAGLVMGLIWGVVYYYYPNFWGVAISHAILGSISIFTGLI